MEAYVVILRAVGISTTLFVMSLIINAIAGRVIGVNLAVALPAELPWSIWLVGMVSAPVLATIGTVWYFADGAVAASAVSGAALGALMIATGIVLDCIFIMPLKNGSKILVGYFKKWQYWFTLALLFVACMVTGVIFSSN
jgi:hypothetical protein